jgi:tetratricopeptide (TPR) repeat protein/predicted Ser/Thr protein kinase
MSRDEHRRQPEDALPPTRPAGAREDPPTLTDHELRADTSVRAGQAFGRFEIRDVLGSGGMGTVFEAHDRTLDRAVALKLLHPDVANQAERRVLQEAQAMAKLSHPHVVQVYETGIVEGRPFIAMELVRGQSLAEWQITRHGWRECVAVYLQAGRGLAAAHARGIAHRDFKPSNCILDEEGRVRVLDFGLAQSISSSVLQVARASRASFETFPSEGPHRREREHGAPGTLGYMPLEQLWGEPLDAKSDQFSFCVSLFEAIHGHRPFGGESVDAMVFAMLDGALDWPPGPALAPPRLRRLLERGLKAQPIARWPGMDDVLLELEQLAHARESRRRPWIFAGLGVAGITAVAGAWWAMETPACPDPHEELDGAWGPERRARVAAAIETAGLDGPAEVLPRLDAYAARWAALRGAACTAERETPEQVAATSGAQRQCLDEARDALEEVGVLLDEHGERTLPSATWWAMGLPSLASCEEPQHFVPMRPLPSDSAQADQVHALRRERAIVQAMFTSGERELAIARFDAVIEDAEALGFAPLLAELEVSRGNAYVEQGQYDAAERDLEQAYARAVEHGHPKIALEAAIGLAYVVGDLREHHDAGYKWGLTAEALARQPWSEPSRLASVMEIMGNVLYEQGRLGAAPERYQQALELRDGVDPEGLLQPFTLANVGLVLHEQGRYEDALPILLEVLALREAQLDPRHPALAVSLVSLGSTLRRLGRHDDALACLQHALDIREEVLGPESPGVVIVLNELGHVWLARGNLPRALDAYQRALSYGTRTLDAGHSHVAEAWLGLGQVLRAHGMLDAAARHVARAVGSYEQAVGTGHPRVGVALVVLGEIEHERGDRESAREHLELAVDNLAKAEVPPAELAAARFALARVLWSSPAERPAALALAEQAFVGFGSLGAATREQAAEVEAWLAVRASR